MADRQVDLIRFKQALRAAAEVNLEVMPKSNRLHIDDNLATTFMQGRQKVKGIAAVRTTHKRPPDPRKRRHLNYRRIWCTS